MFILLIHLLIFIAKDTLLIFLRYDHTTRTFELSQTLPDTMCHRAEITGRIAKRFSGERPDPLGFEFSLFAEFKRVVRWVLVIRSSTRQSAI